MQRANEPPRQDEIGLDEAAQTDERDALIRKLNDALMRWLAEFDAMEDAA